MNGDSINRREEKIGKADININIDELLSNLKVPAGKPKDKVWRSIIESIENQKPVRIISLTQALLRVAASIIIITAIGSSIWVWGFGNVEEYSPKGKQLTVILPDKSTVNLNADTKLSYNKVLWNFSRQVRIEGEGLFKVKKGERFDVIAGKTVTSVLGTTFNVYNREGKIEVSCIEGKVSVESNLTKEKVLLKGGYKTEIKNKTMEKPVEFKKSVEVKWSSGDFYFNNSPIKEVFDELERQFDVDVFYEGDPDRFYTGYFSNKDLGIALGLICIPMDFTYTIKGKVIIVQNNIKR